MVGSMWSNLFEDFEAFMFEKKPFDCSLALFGVSFGEDGNGGSDVKSGEFS